MADDDQFWPANLAPAAAGAFAPQAPEAPPPMSLSADGERFIMGREGWSATPYGDYKQRSIGYGTKAKPGDVSIDQEEGLNRLRAETGPISDWINKNVTTPLSQQQHDALVSFDYNTGGLAKLKGDLNAGDFQKVADRMQTWNKAGGKELDDLKDRRFQEGTMLLGGQPKYKAVAAAGAAPSPGAARRGVAGMADPTDDGSDLGSSLQQKPSLMSALGNPSMQAGLLSMAARLLTGGWGGPASQVGQALGAFGEGAGNQQVYAEQQKHQKEQMAQAKSIADAHNETQLQVANIHAQTMKDVAQTRAGSKLSTQGQSVYNRVYQEEMKNMQLQILQGQMDNATAHVIADQRAMESASRFMQQNPEKGGAGGIGAGPTTGSVAPAPKGATELNDAAKKPPAAKLTWGQIAPNVNWDKFKTDPKYRQSLKDSLDDTGAAALASKEREFGLWQPPQRPAAVQKLLDMVLPKKKAPEAAPAPLPSE